MDPANGVKASFGYPSQTNCRTEEEGDDDCDREDPNPVGGPSDQSITSLGTGAPDSSVHHAPTSPVLIVLGTTSKRSRLAHGRIPGTSHAHQSNENKFHERTCQRKQRDHWMDSHHIGMV